jgi:HK97 family phage prohead protease
MPTSLGETTKRISLAGRVLKADGPKGEVLALVNTGYKDRQRDTLQPGCWQKCIREQQQPPIFWMHDVQQLALGSVVGLQELRPGDPRIPAIDGKSVAPVGGLLSRIRFAIETSRGHDAFILARDGHVKEWSVQIAVDPANEETDRQGNRVVKEVHQLVEISMVVMGASLGTGTLEAKAALQRLESKPEWMVPLLAELQEKAAEDAEDRMYLALEEAETRAWYESQEKAAANAEVERLVDIVRGQLDRERQVAEIEKRVGISGNVFKVAPRPAPRPLTEREKFDRDIARRAGILVG